MADGGCNCSQTEAIREMAEPFESCHRNGSGEIVSLVESNYTNSQTNS